MANIYNVNAEPLVSVCVITYNSSKYIQEALESVFSQTYQSIELIVSDDGSKDDTIETVERWLLYKRNRFVGVKVLTVEQNTGTTNNCNRWLSAAKGDLIKYFAGDDVLFPDAIEKYVSFVRDRPEIKWVFAKAVKYNEVIAEDHIMDDVYDYEKIESILKSSKDYQLRRLVLRNYLWYPTHFFRKSVLEEIGGFDESFGIYEDYPTWLRLYRNGEACFFLNDNTLGYRYTAQGVVNNSVFLVNKKIRKLAFVAKKRFAFDKVTWVERFGTYLLYGSDIFFALPFMNKNTRFRRNLRRFSLISIRKTCYFLQRYVKNAKSK